MESAQCNKGIAEVKATAIPLYDRQLYILLQPTKNPFSDGAVIYWISGNTEISNHPVPISVDDVYAIQATLKGISIVFGVFIAIVRVYKIHDV